MRAVLLVSAATACWIGAAPLAFGGDSGGHAVTVQVTAINELAVNGGNVTLTIDSATAGSEPDAVADATTCDLLWTTNEATRKITVETDLAAPNFALFVIAQNVSGGTAAPQVTVSTTAGDLVTGISETVGWCDLAFAAYATAAQGTGSDVHTIVYTITAE
jgi:hypothetical protein